MRRVVTSPQFEADVAGLWTYIAERNVPAADRVVEAIERKIDLIAAFPGIGTLCPHLAPELRRTFWRDYLIYYREKGALIELVRVLHARRDISPGAFEPPETT
jgi:toxin ParE1/3/4